MTSSGTLEHCVKELAILEQAVENLSENQRESLISALSPLRAALFSLRLEIDEIMLRAERLLLKIGNSSVH